MEVRVCCVLGVLITAALGVCGGQMLNLRKGHACVHDKKVGVCARIERCATVVQVDLKYHAPLTICSYDGDVPVVCCVDCELVEDASQIVVVGTDILHASNGRSKAWDKCLEYGSRLPYKCKESGIVHGFIPHRRYRGDRQCLELELMIATSLLGFAAKRGEFPHMALLGYGEKRQDAEYLCGGSIISERYILTAAHCAAHPALGPLRHVALGILKRSDLPEKWQHYTVQRFIEHPQYEPPFKYNDIALVQTDKEIQFHKEVLPACLATASVSEPRGTVVGWGAIGSRGQLADTLQKAWLNKVNTTECSKLYPPHRLLPNGFNATTQLCYNNDQENYDTCQGDSGGPLQLYQYNGQRCAATVVGVTSYGRACGFPGGAGMYTRVLPYLPWIETIVWS